MEQQTIEMARQYNEQFAARAAEAALAVIEERVAKEKAQGDLNCEVYYSIQNPFAAGSAEHAYAEELLGKGSGRNPAYIDLFDKLRTRLKEALDSRGVHAFLMLNCRFDPQFEDNFLLYALVSWGG